jgi:DNA helicase-2/ATP-dependent DNA helicase PcrA
MTRTSARQPAALDGRPRWREGLNPAQAEAVEHGPGPLVIVAGAGTGKTRTLTSRVASLMDRGIAPERILLLTYTRRAAADMTSRAAALCTDRVSAARITSGTFHAVANGLIAEHAHLLGLPAATVLDQPDVEDLLDLMRADHELTGTRTRLPGPAALADICTRTVNKQISVREVILNEFPAHEPHTDRIAELLRAFMARKRQRGLLDFDDLLTTWRALLRHPQVGERLRGRWDCVLVDEFQDVNQMQVDIVRALCPDGLGLTVVGDDAQAVYGFRGASGAHLQDLADSLPNPTVVRLARNFRSTQPILNVGNAVRPTERGPKLLLHADRKDAGTRPALVRCYDADAQARAVAEAILAAHEDGQALRGQAVLMRSGWHSRELEVELSLRRIPYVKYGGIAFLETAHVKDFLAALRLTTNPADEVAWFRLLCLHPDIGKATARALTAKLIDPDGYDRDAVVSAAPRRGQSKLRSTLELIAAGAARSQVADRVAECLTAIRPLVKGKYNDYIVRLEDLERLAAAAEKSHDLAAFIAEMTLDQASVTSGHAGPPQLDDDYVTLSTVHSAKGLEWETVHVIHLLDGAFPSDMALTSNDALLEEHRLFYVALTRARDELYLYAPTRTHRDRGAHSGRHVIATDSRFLTPEVIATLEIRDRTEGRPGATVPLLGPVVEIPTLDDLFA